MKCALHFVEQKNDTLVRAYLGYARLDTVAHTRLLNQLYDQMWLFYNFFQPVMRLQEKVIHTDPGQRSRIKRRYDIAQTPFDRLCATDILSPAKQTQLHALRVITNPRQLRRDIHSRLDQLLALPLASGDQTEDVYQTLLAAHPTVSPETQSPPQAQGGCGNVDNENHVAHISTTTTTTELILK